MANRPVSRKKFISGSGSVHKRPMGGGFSGGGHRGINGGGKGNLIKIIIIVAVLLIGGGGGLGNLLDSFSGGNVDSNTVATTIDTINTIGNLLLGDTGYTSTTQSGNSSWSRQCNVGVLDTSVAPEARAKYTKIKGSGRDKVTVMVYLCGTDLEARSGMASKDIQEMLDANISDNVNLLVYTGGCSNWKNSKVSNRNNQIFQIKNGKMSLVCDNIGDVSMVNPSTLSDYIQWGARNYPADRYDLILWDHGGGSVTGFAHDERHKSDGSMDLAKINEALSDGGVKFDFVGFDACLMATLETGLMLDSHADYMIASEETEPGIGWCYTNWLTALSKDTSMPTVKVGKNIADDFVSQCASHCSGQKTTLSVVDLAELSATVPEDLKSFASYTSELIDQQEYRVVSDARSSTREFATSSKIDQIDLIDFATKMKSIEGDDLANSLLGAVKYNNCSSSMTNAYGLSIYFPYRNTKKVDKAARTYDQIGMDGSYSQCIQKFASMSYYGQAAGSSQEGSDPASILLGDGSSQAGSTMDNAEILLELFNTFADSGLADEFLGRGISAEDAAAYIAENNINVDDIVWQKNASGDSVIKLTEDQWNQVDGIELSTFVDDGEGYIDLGLDNVFEWDQENNLLAPTDRSWLAIDDQIVAYYLIDTTGTTDNYSITGRVPVMINGQRAELILVFDNAHEQGYIAGATYDYSDDADIQVVAKNLTELQQGDKIDFICNYYDYNGNFNNTYYLGNQMTVTKDMSQMKISNLVIEDKPIKVCFVFTDIYGNKLYTKALAE